MGFSDLFRHNHKPSIGIGIFAGGQSKQLVSICGGHSRIIKGKFPALLHIVRELFLRLCMRKEIELESGIIIYRGLEYCDHFLQTGADFSVLY